MKIKIEYKFFNKNTVDNYYTLKIGNNKKILMNEKNTFKELEKLGYKENEIKQIFNDVFETYKYKILNRYFK